MLWTHLLFCTILKPTAHSHDMFLSSLVMTVQNTEYEHVPLVYKTVAVQDYINSFTSLIYKMCGVFIIKFSKLEQS